MEARDDILVYTSDAFKEGTEVSGPITPTLLCLVRREGHRLHGQGARRLSRRPRLQPRRIDSADALSRRLRQAAGVDGIREGLQGDAAAARPRATTSPPATGCRIEVSSSNFPRFDRNLNTGGNNYDEAKGVVAHNAVHHSKQYPSQITVTVVKRTPTTKRQRSRRDPARLHALQRFLAENTGVSAEPSGLLRPAPEPRGACSVRTSVTVWRHDIGNTF